LAKPGVALKEIVRLTGKSRGLVRQVVRGGRKDTFLSRFSSLDPFLKQPNEDWASGCRNGAALWRRAKLAGFAGGLRVIAEWANRQRNDERAATGAAWPRKAPSARAITRMMTTESGLLSQTVTLTVATI
jgi:hypothetical protein